MIMWIRQRVLGQLKPKQVDNRVGQGRRCFCWMMLMNRQCRVCWWEVLSRSGTFMSKILDCPRRKWKTVRQIEQVGYRGRISLSWPRPYLETRGRRIETRDPEEECRLNWKPCGDVAGLVSCINVAWRWKQWSAVDQPTSLYISGKSIAAAARSTWTYSEGHQQQAQGSLKQRVETPVARDWPGAQSGLSFSSYGSALPRSTGV